MGSSINSQTINNTPLEPEYDIEYFKKCLNLSEEIYGKDHITAVHSLECLGKNYKKIGDNSKAKDCILRAATIKIDKQQYEPFDGQNSQLRPFSSVRFSNMKDRNNPNNNQNNENFPQYRDSPQQFQEMGQQPSPNRAIYQNNFIHNNYNQGTVQQDPTGQQYLEKGTEPSPIRQQIVGQSQNQQTNSVTIQQEQNGKQYFEKGMEISPIKVANYGQSHIIRQSQNQAAGYGNPYQSHIVRESQNQVVGNVYHSAAHGHHQHATIRDSQNYVKQENPSIYGHQQSHTIRDSQNYVERANPSSEIYNQSSNIVMRPSYMNKEYQEDQFKRNGQSYQQTPVQSDVVQQVVQKYTKPRQQLVGSISTSQGPQQNLDDQPSPQFGQGEEDNKGGFMKDLFS